LQNIVVVEVNIYILGEFCDNKLRFQILF